MADTPTWDELREYVLSAGNAYAWWEALQNGEYPFTVPYEALARVPFPYLPHTWELEGLSVQAGTVTNAGSGWNTLTFPEPFDDAPAVVASAEGYQVEVKGVTAERFLYRVVQLSTSTVRFYVATASGGQNTSGATVLSGASMAAVGDKVAVRWMAALQDESE